MPALNHTHTWRQLKTSHRNGLRRNVLQRGEFVFICNDPQCNSKRPRSEILHKENKCPRCGDTFILTPLDLYKVLPTCLKCSNTKAGKIRRDAEALIMGTLLSTIEPTKEEDLSKGWEDPPEESEESSGY